MHLETRVIVTVSAGFVGSHLCQRLLNNAANVICVDNHFTGARRNIDRIIDHRCFDVIRHDVTFPLYIEADQIYNLACPASDPLPARPVQTAKTGLHGAVNTLGLAKRLHAKILRASTSEIYGDPADHPHWGHVNPWSARNVVLRLLGPTPIAHQGCTDTYGPRMHPNAGRVVSNLWCRPCPVEISLRSAMVCKHARFVTSMI